MVNLKDQLRVTAFMKRKEKKLKVFLKMVAMATSNSLLGFLFDSIDCNNSCYFTKQDLILKQAYIVGFCFVLCNKLDFWQLALVFSSFYRLYLDIALFFTKPSEQIIYCYATGVKMLRFFLANCITTHWSLITLEFQEFFFTTPRRRNVTVNSAVAKVDLWEKFALSFLHNVLSI